MMTGWNERVNEESGKLADYGGRDWLYLCASYLNADESDGHALIQAVFHSTLGRVTEKLKRNSEADAAA
jgi:hypothetical protein